MRTSCALTLIHSWDRMCAIDSCSACRVPSGLPVRIAPHSSSTHIYPSHNQSHVFVPPRIITSKSFWFRQFRTQHQRRSHLTCASMVFLSKRDKCLYEFYSSTDITDHFITFQKTLLSQVNAYASLKSLAFLYAFKKAGLIMINWTLRAPCMQPWLIVFISFVTSQSMSLA